MNVERLHAIAACLRQDLDKTSTLSLLQNLVNSLTNQVNQPQQPQYQQQTSQNLSQLLAKLDGASVNEFSPTWHQVLDEIGATQLTGVPLADTIRDIFARNQITASAALQELQALLSDLQQLSAAIDQLLSSFRTLKIGTEDLEPGQCELGVLIPRPFLDDRLDRFAIELRELDRIFGVFSEIVTGSRSGFEIKTISSTDLSVYLEVAARVGACIANAVERIISLYKQLLEVRRLRGELAKQGVEKDGLKGVDSHAKKIMETGIDKLVKDLLADYLPKAEAGRKNELSIELTYTLKKIANRVDRGFNIEVRMSEPDVEAENSENASAQNQELLRAHATISDATKNMQFLKLEGDPVLQLTETKEDKPEN